MKNTIICIEGDITFEKGFSWSKKIIQLSQNTDVEKIILLISSSGGEICVLPFIAEAIKMSGKEVITIGAMFVASSATSLFMMGKRRILFPDTEFLIHQSRISRYYCDEINDEIRNDLEEKTKLLWEPVVNNSSLTYEELFKITEEREDLILTEEEIQKNGITTESYNEEVVKKLLLEGEFVN